MGGVTSAIATAFMHGRVVMGGRVADISWPLGTYVPLSASTVMVGQGYGI